MRSSTSIHLELFQIVMGILIFKPGIYIICFMSFCSTNKHKLENQVLAYELEIEDFLK